MYGYPYERRLNVPKASRPPPDDSSRSKGYRLRMSDEELRQLEYCCEVLGLPKAEIIRQGLDIMYEKALNKWSEELGINYRTLRQRIYAYGWSVDRAFSTPVNQK